MEAITHLEKVITGEASAITHLEKVIAEETTAVTYTERVIAGEAPPITHLEKVITGIASPVTHLEQVWTGRTPEYTGAVPTSFMANGQPLLDYTIYGNMAQTGTPTPTTPIQPQETGERTGNLFNMYSYSGASADISDIVIGKDSVTFNASSQYLAIVYEFNLGIADIYTLSLGGDSVNTRLEIRFTKNGSLVGGAIVIQPNRNTTISGSDEYDGFRVYISNANNIGTCTASNIMLNTGSTALPYEPYGYKLDISNSGENLCLVSQNNSITYSDFNNYVVSNNSITSTGQALLGFKCKVEPNTSYTISIKKNVSVDLRIREYSSEPTDWETNFITQSLNTTQTTASITTTQNTTWILVTFWFSAGGRTVYDIMLNLGSEPLPYEPYVQPTISNIYLGEVQTTRRIRKLVLTGKENITQHGVQNDIIGVRIPTPSSVLGASIVICSHYEGVLWPVYNGYRRYGIVASNPSSGNAIVYMSAPDSEHNTLSTFVQWIKDQYAAGTPVTIWYVLAEPTTGIVNEPIRKIGDYADTVSYEQAGVQIPTNKGNTVIDVETELKPSEMYIKYQE